MTNLTARQHEYLRLMGIQVWQRRSATPVPGASAPAASEAAIAARATPAADADAWESLRREVAGCTRCALHQGRTNTVFGVGDTAAEWLVIGEAPGAEEDRRGEPFVGRAGQLLNAMLEAIGLRREQVYIANIIKCRPPKNRDPRPEEAAACEPYLREQIRLLRPRIILAVGRIAAQNLLKQDTPIGRMRGKTFEFSESGIPVVVTYHPAYLLRSPQEKRKAWQDLQLAMSVYRGLP